LGNRGQKSPIGQGAGKNLSLLLAKAFWHVTNAKRFTNGCARYFNFSTVFVKFCNYGNSAQLSLLNGILKAVHEYGGWLSICIFLTLCAMFLPSPAEPIP